jgi:uncharacterized protein YbjT (DUF2867 family)
MAQHNTPHTAPLILLTGGTGTTGRRIAHRLRTHNVDVRCASRAGAPSFDWNQPDTWPANLDLVRSAYIAYSPDLAMPGAVDTIDRFCIAARLAGVEQLVLLAGRGESEAEAAEEVVRGSGLRWTIVRASWFNQNFSEGMLLPAVLAGMIALPGGTVREPFVDVEDIADVAVAALLGVDHDGCTYDVTGPRLMTFAEAADELASAVERPVKYLHVTGGEFIAGAVSDGVPVEVAEGLAAMFDSVLDGRNAHIGDGVREALGRDPRDFTDFVARAAADGAWDTAFTGQAS